jgi:hypothetical protein
MASDVDSNGYDDQDGAEAFDEDNQGLDGAGENDRGEMRTFEELPDVLDVTAAEGDADDDDALIGEELDDDEIIQLEADRDLADEEDDPEASRLADDAPDDFARETSEAGSNRADRSEAGLSFTDDTDDEQAEAGGIASRFESRRLSDDDLEDLGYRSTEED